MLRIVLASIVLGLLVGLPACGSDDDGGNTVIPEGPADLQEMAQCFSDGLVQLGFAIETCVILFHDLERDVAYTPPFGFGYVEQTGEFLFDTVVSEDPLVKWEINGFVSPVDTVANGLQQGDIFTVSWSIYEHETFQDVAAGEFRVIDQGLTSPPNQTESLRVIPAGDIWCGPDPSCRTEYTQFELTVHHLLPQDNVRNALASFRCFNAVGDTLNGYFSASEATGMGSVTGVYDGVSYTCDVDLDTYAVDCSGP